MATGPELASYKEVLILLGTAGVVVPIVHRLQVSPILGFLVAGALLGPHLLGAVAQQVPVLSWITISDSKEITWLGELGVVFLLFVIGLELSPQRLLTMRRLVFGLGTLQLVSAAALLGMIAQLAGSTPQAALLIGLALALSSTAIVVEILADQDRLSSSTGRASFSILLLQDLAVVPILFLVGVLGAGSGMSVAASLGVAALQAAAALLAIVAFGLLLLRPLFRLVASTASPELFTAATMLVVIGTGVVTASAGLSMGLGAFVGGVLLAETEYRRAVEATIEPFKGLLLGVFFFSVGMSIDVSVVLSNPVLVLAGAIGLVALKAALAAPLARWYGLSWPAATETALLLGPGGEFAFIIIGMAAAAGIIPAATAGLLLATVAVTMAALPVLAVLGRRLTVSWRERALTDPELLAAPAPSAQRAIVIGYGRVGSLVGSMLDRHGQPYIATDYHARTVTEARKAGHPVYFGDAKTIAFLERCGLREASVLIVTIHTPKEIDAIVQAARSLRRDVPIVSRARDAIHARHLYALGVSDAVPETIEASLQLSEAALVAMGVPTGPVIASIHEKRDEFRALLQRAADGRRETPSRGVRSKVGNRE